MCASTAYVKNNLANYLPLTGGTVSGALNRKGENYFYGNPNYTNESGHIFGIDNTDWKYLGMYGYGEKAGGFEAFAEDSPKNASGFNCRARGTNGEYYDLGGRSDGSLLWAGKNIVRSVNGTVAGTDGNVTLSLSYLPLSGGTCTGTVYAPAFQISSDRRLKTSLKRVESSLDKVSKLVAYSYDKQGVEGKQVGVIAQEVEEVLPEAVREDPNGYKTVDYSALTALLINAINELRGEINGIKLS